MIVKVKPHWHREPFARDLSSAVSDSLDGSGYGDGEIERISRTVDNIREFCGTLAEALVMRGHLDLADVIRALPSGHGIVESEGS